MKHTSAQKKLLDALLKIKQDNSSSSRGLCYEVYKLSDSYNVAEEFRRIYKTWPKYSGSTVFPVPCPSGGKSSDVFRATENMWINKYGEDRIDLLNFCLTYLGGKQIGGK